MLGKGTDGVVLDLGDRVGRTMGWMLLGIGSGMIWDAMGLNTTILLCH